VTVTAVVFDMGGVLVELGPVQEILGEGVDTSVEEFWAAWLASASVREFERGRMEPDEFASAIVAEVGIDLTPQQLLTNFTAWPKGLYPGAEALVADVNQVADTGVLSNTNRLHWETQVDNDIMRRLFTREYLSFAIGLVKPDADVFEHIVADLGRPAEAILFLDDNQINVDAARASGLASERVVGPDAARAAIAAHGLNVA